MPVNFAEKKKEYINKRTTKGKKRMITSMIAKKQLRKYEKEVKKVICCNLDDEGKEYLKKQENKRKKRKR